MSRDERQAQFAVTSSVRSSPPSSRDIGHLCCLSAACESSMGRLLLLVLLPILVCASFAHTRSPDSVHHYHYRRAALVARSTAPHALWQEVQIATSETIKSHDGGNVAAGQAIEKGDSVFVLPDFVTSTECESLTSTAYECAEEIKRASGADQFKESVQAARVRIPTIEAAARANDEGFSCPPPLQSDSNQLVEEIFERVFAYIDEHLPSIRTHLFGEACESLVGLHRAAELKWACREPAINVYDANGEFLPHTDEQALTVIIPLTSPAADDDDGGGGGGDGGGDGGGFTGGGTGFWRQGADDHRVDAPSTVLRPSAGTVMLFGGRVLHSGMPVDAGTRVVLVASFSLGESAEPATRRAADIWDLAWDSTESAEDLAAAMLAGLV